MRPLKPAPSGWRERFAIAHREIMQIARDTAPAREAMRQYYLAHPPAAAVEAWGEPMKYQSASTAIPQFRPPDITRAALAALAARFPDWTVTELSQALASGHYDVCDR